MGGWVGECAAVMVFHARASDTRLRPCPAHTRRASAMPASSEGTPTIFFTLLYGGYRVMSLVVAHTPGPTFKARNSTLKRVSAPGRAVFERSRPKLSGNEPSGIGHLVVAE